jgi:hypothetical protein
MRPALAKLKSMSKKLTGLRIAGPLVAGRWLRALLSRSPPPSAAQQRAADLIAGIDAGGLPLHPARVNDIARQLGLPVSKSEPVGDTVVRIRTALKRQRP